MEQTVIFQSRLVEPFTSLLGEPLRDVEYWVMKTDADDFHVEKPNLFGVQVIRLRFGAVSLAITWGGEKQLLSEAMHHHNENSPEQAPGYLTDSWPESQRPQVSPPERAEDDKTGNGASTGE